MMTLIFGRMVVHKEKANEGKKIIYIFWMVVCKGKKYINKDPNFWSNGRALKKLEKKEDPITWSSGRLQIKK